MHLCIFMCLSGEDFLIPYYQQKRTLTLSNFLFLQFSFGCWYLSSSQPTSYCFSNKVTWPNNMSFIYILELYWNIFAWFLVEKKNLVIYLTLYADHQFSLCMKQATFSVISLRPPIEPILFWLVSFQRLHLGRHRTNWEAKQ